jgi:hypothetical protein
MMHYGYFVDYIRCEAFIYSVGYRLSIVGGNERGRERKSE